LGSENFKVKGSSLPGRLGINRDQLRQLRTEFLTQGKHWVIKHRRIYYSAEGVLGLETVLGLEKRAAEPIAERPEVEFKVWRKVLNPKILLVKDGEKIARVRVKNAEHWLPGMVIRCSHVQEDLYEAAGPSPRFRGRM